MSYFLLFVVLKVHGGHAFICLFVSTSNLCYFAADPEREREREVEETLR